MLEQNSVLERPARQGGRGPFRASVGPSLLVGLWLLLGLTLFGSPAAVGAQNSNFGTVTLLPGFMPDPHIVSGTSGGQTDASSKSSQCRGWISSTPDHILRVRTSFSFLRIVVASSEDTTLVVAGPSGQLRCDDDTYELNPSVEGSFAPGTYQIWVGSYRRGTNAAYQLGFSELRSVTASSLGGGGSSGAASSGAASQGAASAPVGRGVP
ncbi:MAG: hypothetical protein OEY14_14350, partial [Myxococcales bacterium]|nr:hypothetical protein [Myxococcales bacterium]